MLVTKWGGWLIYGGCDMTDKDKKKDNSPPQIQELLEGFNAMTEVMQQHGTAIQGLMDVLGVRVSGDGSKGSTEAVLDGDARQGGIAQQPRQYPYDLARAQVELELTKLMFATEVDKLPELTETPRTQVQPTAALESYNIYIGNMEQAASLVKQGRKAEAIEVYEPLESIFIRCRDRRMLSVQRRSRQEAMIFNQVQQEKKAAEEGQEAGF